MKLRGVWVGLALVLSGWIITACGSVVAPSLPTPVATPVPTPGLPVIMAAGDISCDSATPQLSCKSPETSDLILGQIPLHTQVVVLPLGDLQYNDGTLAEFRKNYDATWGRLNAISHPVPGNHEYQTANASGYFDYFAEKNVNVGPRGQGWYAYPIGSWRFIALNSNCERVGGCGTGSPQYAFLQNELAANKSKCTVAYMHYPFLSSGQNGSNPQLLPLMRLLYDGGVDIVLAGHDHDYERFMPINPANNPEAVADPARGMRLFVVGTGGRDQTGFPGERFATTATRSTNNFGALRIVMKEGAYEWDFVNISGALQDNGSATCSP